LPDAGSGGESGFTFEASTSNEIYWQRQSVTIPLTTDVSFLLKPQFVKAKLALDAGTGRTITSVAAGSISLDAASSGNFSLKTGGFNAGTEGVAFTGWATIGERTVTSGEITFLPKATNYIISWLADAVTVTDGATSESSAAGRATILNSKLAAGGSYRIRLKPLRFAGSNIYWEGGDDGKLTFDLHGDDIHAKYQGVYFQWGSLIGVSPVGEDYESSATVLYKPKGATMPRAWEPPATGSALSPVWNSWTDIPSYYNVDVSPAGIDAHTLLYNPDFDNYRGDICNYINSSYRMPTLAELTALSSAYVGFYHDSDNVPVSSDDENVAGRYVFTDNYGTLSGYALPASGCRSSNSGTLYDVGYSGSYWSGSAYGSSSGAYRLYFSGSGISTDSYARYYGRSVRCVMIE
jgi:hypothetical protein